MYGMHKTTVYLPESLELRLDAFAASSGVSKAELIRKAVADMLDKLAPPTDSRSLPMFDSGRPMTPESMNDSVYVHIKQQAARR